MFRKDLIGFLHHHPMEVKDIARLCGVSPGDAEQDLQHLIKSLKQSPYRLNVHPATCRKCDFRFSATKLTKPGKCPRCKGTWIEAPRVEIVDR